MKRLNSRVFSLFIILPIVLFGISCTDAGYYTVLEKGDGSKITLYQ